MRRLLVFAALVFAVPAHAAPMFMGLGDFEGGIFISTAFAASADGSVVVGQGYGATGEAFRWTPATGMVRFLASGSLPSSARAVSGDGSVIVGASSSAGVFRWTEATGMVGLGMDSALAVSADGSVVVGYSASGGLNAVRWTEATGIVGLGDIAGG